LLLLPLLVLVLAPLVLPLLSWPLVMVVLPLLVLLPLRSSTPALAFDRAQSRSFVRSFVHSFVRLCILPGRARSSFVRAHFGLSCIKFIVSTYQTHLYTMYY
jgi:hypothetical protein